MSKKQLIWLQIFLILLVTAGVLIYLFLPSRAFAADTNAPLNTDVPLSLSFSLKAGGGGPYEHAVLIGWKTMLGIADVFVVIVLLFLAVVNILHLPYDTYALKKSLPNLIIAVILANFSLFICRMFVDVANVLTKTFTGPDIAHGLLGPLVCNLGLVQIGSDVGTAALIGLILAPGASITLGLLVLLLIIVALPVIAVVILLFLLYIRIAVILVLAMVSPAVFVMMAFPPTQGIFKQWWSWFTKWVFMKPIIFVILWAAVLLGNGECLKHPDTPQGITLISWLITAGLTYFAFIVPFKLGGAIMSSWAGVGKWITGTGKGGYTRRGMGYVTGQAKQEAHWLARTKSGRFGQWMDRTIVNRKQRTGQQIRDIEKGEQLIWLQKGDELKKRMLDINYKADEADKQVMKETGKFRLEAMDPHKDKPVEQLKGEFEEFVNDGTWADFLNGALIEKGKLKNMGDRNKLDEMLGLHGTLMSRLYNSATSDEALKAIGEINANVKDMGGKFIPIEQVNITTGRRSPFPASANPPEGGGSDMESFRNSAEEAVRYLRRINVPDVHIDAIIDEVKQGKSLQELQGSLTRRLTQKIAVDAQIDQTQVEQALAAMRQNQAANLDQELVSKITVRPEFAGISAIDSGAFRQQFGDLGEQMQKKFNRSFETNVEVPLNLAMRLIPQETKIENIDSVLTGQEQAIQKALEEVKSSTPLQIQQVRDIVAKIDPKLVGGIVNKESAVRHLRNVLEGTRWLMSQTLREELKKQKTLTELLPKAVLQKAKKEYNRVSRGSEPKQTQPPSQPEPKAPQESDQTDQGTNTT